MGFLFIDGQYLEPPYHISLTDTSLEINATVYDETSFDLSRFQRSGREDGRDHRGYGRGSRSGMRGERDFANGPHSMRRSSSPLLGLYDEIKSIEIGSIVVLRSQKKPMLLWLDQYGSDLLAALTTSSSKSEASIDVPLSVQNNGHKETWQQLVSGFQPSEPLLQRIEQETQRIQFAEQSTAHELTVKKWMDAITYPLTMLALILVVFAVGHLMANASSIFAIADSPSIETSGALNRNVVHSLVIVGGLSLIDLIWTLMAHHNGAMRELNPIGSRLIANPALLVGFKILVTGTSIGILYWLRQQPLARKATWWCCLVLTLLTARWLTFHSLLA